MQNYWGFVELSLMQGWGFFIFIFLKNRKNQIFLFKLIVSTFLFHVMGQYMHLKFFTKNTQPWFNLSTLFELSPLGLEYTMWKMCFFEHHFRTWFHLTTANNKMSPYFFWNWTEGILSFLFWIITVPTVQNMGLVLSYSDHGQPAGSVTIFQPIPRHTPTHTPHPPTFIPNPIDFDATYKSFPFRLNKSRPISPKILDSRHPYTVHV